MPKHLKRTNPTLPINFWLVFVLGNLLLAGSYMLIKQEVNSHIPGTAKVMLALLCCILVFMVASAIRTWRSANRGECYFIWEDCAKIGVIYGLLLQSGWIYLQTKPLLSLLRLG